MPNSYFQFKQFTIHQDKSAMKVCTDACLFGAWVANKLNEINANDILDIGTGTGLLSLMLSQHSAATITAIEIDPSAAEQAAENFAASSFHQQLNVINTDINEFFPNNNYDLIVSNPPFYDNDLKSHDKQRNYALHSDALTFELLLSAVNRSLATGGSFAVILPYHRVNEFISVANKCKLYVKEQMQIRQTEKHSFFRSFLMLSNESVKTVIEDEIIIKEDGHYSSKFIMLLHDYYLHL